MEHGFDFQSQGLKAENGNLKINLNLKLAPIIPMNAEETLRTEKLRKKNVILRSATSAKLRIEMQLYYLASTTHAVTRVL